MPAAFDPRMAPCDLSAVLRIAPRDELRVEIYVVILQYNSRKNNFVKQFLHMCGRERGLVLLEKRDAGLYNTVGIGAFKARDNLRATPCDVKALT